MRGAGGDGVREYNAAQGLVDDSCRVVVELGEREVAEVVKRLIKGNLAYKEISSSAFLRLRNIPRMKLL